METGIVFDTETTGLIKPCANSLRDQPYMTEIFCYKIDEHANIIDELGFLVKPPVSIPEEITRITGISDDTVAGCPSFADKYPDLVEFFLGCKFLIGHNVAFDTGILELELRRMDKLIQFPWPPLHICTAELSAKLDGQRKSLGKLYQHFFGSAHQGSHRAQADVDATLECFKQLVEEDAK